VGGRELICGSAHRFDIARQGYVNLTTGRGGPGTADTAVMVVARDRSTTGANPSDRTPSRSPNSAAPQLISISRPTGSARSLRPESACNSIACSPHPEPPWLSVLHRRRAGGRRDQEVSLAGRDRYRALGLVLGHFPHLRALARYPLLRRAWPGPAARLP
jgi:hypothetical protein